MHKNQETTIYHRYQDFVGAVMDATEGNEEERETALEWLYKSAALFREYMGNYNGYDQHPEGSRFTITCFEDEPSFSEQLEAEQAQKEGKELSFELEGVPQGTYNQVLQQEDGTVFLRRDDGEWVNCGTPKNQS